MSKFIGALIRRERLRRNLSQEGLCKGVCAVSWLSKIEQGKAEAGEDVLRPLAERLGIQYETDPDFLAKAEQIVEEDYALHFSNRTEPPEFAEKLEWLLQNRARCAASPCFLDVLLLEADRNNEFPPELSEFAPAMDGRQYAMYLYLRLRLNGEDTAEELLRLSPCAYYTYIVACWRLENGKFLAAYGLYQRTYELAAREGEPLLMAQAQLGLGGCASADGDWEAMLEHYRTGRKLLQAVGDPDGAISVIDYNTAATYLDLGQPERALPLLEAVGPRDALCCHKLAIALERLGRREEALEAVNKGRELEADSTTQPAIREMLDLVAYRLEHPGYLKDRAYSSLMEDTFALLRRTMPAGFVRFHLPYYLEVLEAERRYRDAYRLTLELSDLAWVKGTLSGRE